MKTSSLTKPTKSATRKHQTAAISPEIYDHDPYKAIQNGKMMAKAWISRLEKDRMHAAQMFIFHCIEKYWQKLHAAYGLVSLPYLFAKLEPVQLDDAVSSVAEAIGDASAKLSVQESSFEIGNLYTALLPESTRTAGGLFYTPPSLARRLIEMAQSAGIDWRTAKVLDPACGGGAFLAPVCLQMLSSLEQLLPEEKVAHIQSHLAGWEVDPFGAWMTQVFVEAALMDVQAACRIRLRPIVTVKDSLNATIIPETKQFDLVIANPPYGKIKLEDSIRERYHFSLYGHPNYYGLFTHLSFEVVKEGGCVALLTPTSFLSGEYFKNLRKFILQKAQPTEIDFVDVRKGVFEDVLQETMLAAYRKEKGVHATVKVNLLISSTDLPFTILPAGEYSLPTAIDEPWILPRIPEQALLVGDMNRLRSRLAHWGYKVSTGPLVWNRHKKQLGKKAGKDRFPIIWAEAITADGTFIWRSDKKNHEPYCTIGAGDEWLLTTKPCILLQRTTAKEQGKRLIAAALPKAFLKKTTAVVIENHLNMLIPQSNTPKVAPEVLAAFLNSKATNDAFRTISGSVAVSAYELEALPLPDADQLEPLRLAIKTGDQEAIEKVCLALYRR